MASKFGLLSKLTIIQDIASSFIASVDGAIIHNIEKYLALNKIFYYTSTEGIEGDYLEFGVYTGSSFTCAMKCCRKNFKYLTGGGKFFGFDSFKGFGELDNKDKHNFFQDENFPSSLKLVEKRVKRFRKTFDIQLIEGFFCDSLKDGAASLGITKAKIIFVDSDTYTAAKDVFDFCAPIVQNGTIVVLDDAMSYKGNPNAGESLAFREFIEKNKLIAIDFFSYGVGSKVYILSGVGEI